MKLKFLLFAFALMAISSVPLYANPDFGIQFDYNKFINLAGGDTGIGGRVVLGSSLSFIGSFDYYFSNHIDNLTFYEINGNIVYSLPTPEVRPYFGAGVGVAHQSFSEPLVPDSESKVGFNLVGGIKFDAKVKPFIEFRYVFHTTGTIFTGNRYVLTGGILF